MTNDSNNGLISARICKNEETDLKKFADAMGIGHTSLAGLFVKLGLDLFKEYEKALINDGLPNFEVGFKKMFRPRYDYIPFQIGFSLEARREFINFIITQSKITAQKSGDKQK